MKNYRFYLSGKGQQASKAAIGHTQDQSNFKLLRQMADVLGRTLWRLYSLQTGIANSLLCVS